MKVGILGWDYGEHDPDSVWLTGIGRELGYDTTLFVLDDVVCAPATHGLEPWVHGRPVRSFDVVISRARLRPERWQHDLELLRLVSEVPGTPILDPADTWAAAESKFTMMQRLSAAGLPTPPTRSCARLSDVAQCWHDWGALVLKPSDGFGGTDVTRINRLPEEIPVVAEVLSRHRLLLGQPYYRSDEGDVRITVVGDAACPINLRRIPGPGDWRANVSQGGRAELFDPPADLVELAVLASRAMALSVAGVDVLPTDDGPMILEVNNAPGGFYIVPDEVRREAIAAVYRLAERAVQDCR